MSLVITDDFYLQLTGECGEIIKPSYSRFMYKNFTKSITTSSHVDGYSGDLALNQNTYQYWMPSSIPASAEVTLTESIEIDYVAIGAHTIRSDSNVSIEYWDGSKYVTIQSKSNISKNAIIFLFNPVSTDKVKITISDGLIPQVGVIYIGKSMVIPAPIDGGFLPFQFNQQVKRSNNVSEGGHLLGSNVIRSSMKGEPSWSVTTKKWYREVFFDFYEAMCTGYAPSFFFAWNPELYPDDSYYCWCDPSNVKPKVNRQFMGFKVPMEAYID